MSKFQLWVDDSNVAQNTQAYNTFVDDRQRKNGFQAGEPASSIRVNTALRQASLIVCALMETIAANDTTHDYTTDLTTMKGVVEAGLKSVKVNNASHADTSNIAQYASSDTSKGTIEERLTALGFRQGTVILNSTYESKLTVPANLITREGNRCVANGEIISITGKQFDVGYSELIGTLPEEFRPKVDTMLAGDLGDGDPITYPFTQNTPICVLIETNGNVSIKGNTGINFICIFQGVSTQYRAVKLTNAGWECNPIT